MTTSNSSEILLIEHQRLKEWASDAESRKRNLVANPATLFRFTD